jgi:hypothetical protein
MKQKLFSFLCVFASVSSYGELPFSISGDKISAIFKSSQLWQKLGGAVETIIFKGHNENTSLFAITTTESIPILDSSGATVGYKNVPCLVLVDVTDKNSEEFIPNWQVTNVDFTACPLTSRQ